MFRLLKRENQQIDSAKCRLILGNEKRGVLALEGRDGYPYALPIDYVYDEQKNALYFHSAREGHKMDAIMHNDHASFCVMGPDTFKDSWAPFVDSVIVFGKIHIVTDRNAALKQLKAIGKKYFPIDEYPEGSAEKNVGRVYILCMEIDHMTGKTVHEK
jgi:nitroimidazol reductase NimA-like FMN-containing flavoprotein (pyridoxamine 5'-phosphate oxidase superfamily)